jgi:hypothetical protein
MLVLLQVAVAGIPPNVTVLEPCVAPKFVPATVTDVPIGPDAGVRLVIAGAVTVATGFTSTRLRLKASVVGAVSFIVMAVALAGTNVGTCCTHNVHV